MTTTLKTTNARIDSAEQSIEENRRRIEALETQVPDAITASLRKLAEEEAERRIEKFKEDLGETTRNLVAKHFPETGERRYTNFGMETKDARTVAYFPAIHIQSSSILRKPNTIGYCECKETELRSRLANLIFQQRVQCLIQATDPAKKETD